MPDNEWTQAEMTFLSRSTFARLKRINRTFILRSEDSVITMQLLYAIIVNLIM